jgi:hypothetical protein
MDDFNFNADQTSQQNIDEFFSHLSTIDSELADLLKQHFSDLLPLPEQGARRNALRKQFNERIRDSLDAAISDEGTEQ